MDRSMVHELNPLVASNVQFSRVAFIHTNIQSDFNELRKSRIQNLPNYRRQDLSNKMNFVVVFQSIQIERLSIEIQTLRVKLKDYERQIGNYQNYQVQIRELTQKCHSYEMQRQDQRDATQKIHLICQQLYNQLQETRNRYADFDVSLKEKYKFEVQRCQSLSNEVQKWKARYNASQTSKAKQLQDMRMMLQNQRKSMLQRELREISVKYESQRSMLQNELRKLRQALDNRNNQLQRIKFLFQQTKMRQGQFRQYEARLDQYEDKLIMTAQQNMRLNQLLRTKKEEIQNLKNNQRNLQNRLSTFKKIQDQFNQVNRRIQSYEIQLRQWNQKYSRLQAQNNRNQILSQKAQQYERLLDSSADEMERMNSIIRQKMSEIQKWKAQTQRLTMDLEQSRVTQSKIANYQSNITQIANENDRLNQILKNRLQQIQNWKLKFTQLQTKMPLLNQSQSECRSLRQQLVLELNSKTQLSQRIKLLQQDLSRAAQMQHLLQKQKISGHQMHKQNQRLNNTIRSISSQNNDYSKKMQSLQTQMRQNTGILDDLNQCKRKIAYLTIEIDKINGILHQKIREIKQLKENYNSVAINTNRYRVIEEQFAKNIQQTEQLVLKLDQSRRQNQCIQEKIFSMESACKRLESELFNNNQQKQKLMSLLNQKKKQADDYLMRIDQFQNKISSLQQVQQQYKKIKANYSQLEQSFKDLQIRLSKQIKRSEEYSNQSQQMANQIMKLKKQTNFSKQFVSQFMILKSQSEEKDRTIIFLMQKITVVEKIIGLLKQQLKKNYNNFCNHQTKYDAFAKNFEYVNNFMNKYVDLQSKIEQLSQQNFMLESNVKLMGIQMAQSTYAVQSRRLQQNLSQSIWPIPQQHSSSPSQKLSTIVQQTLSTPTTQHQSNYYQSRVHEVHNTPSQYSQQSYQPSNGNTSYTMKTLRPGSNQTTTYTTYSNYGGSQFGSSYASNNEVRIISPKTSYQTSNVSGTSTITKSRQSETGLLGTDLNSFNNYQQLQQPSSTDSAKYVVSPVRYFKP